MIKDGNKENVITLMLLPFLHLRGCDHLSSHFIDEHILVVVVLVPVHNGVSNKCILMSFD
jgi:hypothetical protein